MEATVSLTKNVPLKYLVLAILSLASVRGQKKFSITEFYQAFSILVDRFPKMFPGLAFAGAPHNRYSKRLDDALGGWIPYSIELDVYSSSVSVTQETAIRYLGRFKEKYGGELINSLTPISEQFVFELNSTS